jgi:hypothetical protein
MRKRNNPHHIKHDLYDGQPASWASIYRQLGLDPIKHLPVEGLPPRTVQGIKVWITPTPTDRANPDRNARRMVWKSSTHRVIGECPKCKRCMGVSRLIQHTCRPPRQGDTVLDGQDRPGVIDGPRCEWCVMAGVANCRHMGE